MPRPLRPLAHLAVLACLLVVVTGCPKDAEPAPAPLTATEITIRDAAIAWRTGTLSTDPATREAAYDAVQPTQADLALLFGPDVAALVWPDTLTGIEYGRTRLEHAQRRAIRSGGVVGASLVDIRSDAITAFDYTEVLTMIPADIPAYVVMFDRERGVHGVGVFLLLNGRVRYISGLERFPAFIRDLHAQAPAAATSDTAAPTQD